MPSAIRSLAGRSWTGTKGIQASHGPRLPVSYWPFLIDLGGGEVSMETREITALPFTHCNWFKARSLAGVIVRVSVVLKRTSVVDNDWRFAGDNLSGHLQSHLNCK